MTDNKTDINQGLEGSADAPCSASDAPPTGVAPFGKNTNCVFVGTNAGIDQTEGDGLVIIGDNIRSMDQSQSNVLFLGGKLAIGKTVFGHPCSLFDLVAGALNTVGIDSIPNGPNERAQRRPAEQVG